jgi:cytochrome P450
MTAVARAEIARWPRDKPVRLHPRMQTLTLEIILRTVFGLSESKRLDQLRAEMIRIFTRTSGVSTQLFLVALGPQRIRVELVRRLLRGVDRLLYAEIDERRRADDLDERTDVLSTLLRAKHEDGHPMSDVEIRDELMTLLLAGHETTATSLAWAVERLVRHPGLHARLVDEIRAGQDEFLDAVVKETLRLKPVISVVSRRLKAPMEIGGVSLPAGINVMPSIYLMHRRPEIYPDPERFSPERFLGKHGGTYTWIPFGGGVRRCIGEAFAEFEMREVLATLFADCTVRPTNERPEAVRRGGISPVPARGASVVLGD